MKNLTKEATLKSYTVTFLTHFDVADTEDGEYCPNSRVEVSAPSAPEAEALVQARPDCAAVLKVAPRE